MKFLYRFSIRTRLVALVGSVLAVLLLTTIVTRSGVSSIRSNAQVSETDVKLSSSLSAAYSAWLNNDSANNMYVAVLAMKDPAQAKLAEDTWNVAAKAYTDAVTNIDAFASLATTPSDKKIATDIKASLAAYNEFSTKVRASGQGGDIATALKVMTVDNLDASTKLVANLDAETGALAKRGTKSAAEVLDKANTLGSQALTLFAIGLLLAIGLAFALIRSFTTPIHDTLAMLAKLGDGDLSGRATVFGTDEFAKIANALNSAAANLGAAEEREAANRAVEAERQLDMSRNAATLATASEQLATVAGSMSVGADTTARQASVLAQASDEINANTHSVAAALEEMQASITEIARGAVDASATAVEAVQITRSTKDVIAALGTSSEEIGEVVEAISSIAEDTNMLALNATIEAARAGEAGKGFAVVATEVKELANETAKATHDIKERIQRIQTDTRSAIDAIERVANVIDKINQSQEMIAAAVEEQSATTSEMVRTISDVAGGIGEVSESVRGMVETAQTTADGANETLQSAADLAELAQTLQGRPSNDGVIMYAG